MSSVAEVISTSPLQAFCVTCTGASAVGQLLYPGPTSWAFGCPSCRETWDLIAFAGKPIGGKALSTGSQNPPRPGPSTAPTPTKATPFPGFYAANGHQVSDLGHLWESAGYMPRGNRTVIWKCKHCGSVCHDDGTNAFPTYGCIAKAAAPKHILPLAAQPNTSSLVVRQYSHNTGQCDTVRYDGHNFELYPSSTVAGLNFFECTNCKTCIDDTPAHRFPSDSCAAIQARNQHQQHVQIAAAIANTPQITAGGNGLLGYGPTPGINTQTYPQWKGATASSPNPTPPSPPAGHSYSVWDDALPDATPSPEPVERPTCLHCRVELSAYLDAYYGEDTYWSSVCAPCREKRGIR